MCQPQLLALLVFGMDGVGRLPPFIAAAVADRAKWGEKQSKAGATQDSWALWIWEDHPYWCGDCPRTFPPLSLPT